MAEITTHTCPQCGASFPTDAQLQEHIASAHRPNEPKPAKAS